MLGVFISSFDELSKQVFKDFISFVAVSPTPSEIAMAALAETSKDQDMDIKRFSVLFVMVLIPCLAKPMLFNDASKITHHMQST